MKLNVTKEKIVSPKSLFFELLAIWTKTKHKIDVISSVTNISRLKTLYRIRCACSKFVTGITSCFEFST